ncbi:MAG: HutD family protein [Aerococcus sp.]|nr:HutD family protein [Aerococcus sp.]
MIQLLTPKDYSIRAWSGGETTELFIFPTDASYTERTFQVRISTATVTVSASTFTSLPGFLRVISLLEGELSLTHYENSGKRHVQLTPFQLDTFSGEIVTTSQGTCRDFNLMLSGDMTGSLTPFTRGQVDCQNMEQWVIYAIQPLQVHLADSVYTLNPKETLVISEFTGTLMIENASPNIGAMLCHFAPKRG